MSQPPSDPAPVLLAVEDLTKTFGDTVALNRVNFSVLAGEVHCLVGENGAGKSTLIKILAGAERPDSGRIVAFGMPYSRFQPRDALSLGIATIYQDVELIQSLSVADNIFLGNELRTAAGTINYHLQNRRARELMDKLRINIAERAAVEELSPGEQQMLQIVKALHIRARVLIMDEPTSSLGVDETRALMQLIRDLAGQGIGIIYISHFLEEIFRIADRITVLKDGQVIETKAASQTNLAAVTRSMIGRDPSLFFERERAQIGEVILEVRGLTRQDRFKNVSFDLHRGEILGFGGIVGAGRSEVMNVLFGADRRDAGRVRLRGSEIRPKTPWDAIAQGLALIPEDRKLLGLFSLRSVLENAAVVTNQAHGFLLDHRAEQTKVSGLIQQLRIVTAGMQQPIGFLSGGNQQKVILGRWLLSRAEVFIFDEPTKGVDIGAKEQIYELMVMLAKEGKAILMVSSDMPELISMSDRIAVMRHGELVTIVQSKAVTEHQLLEFFLGIVTPLTSDS
jgi:ribose transport system ATP-binding protein